MSCSSIGTQFYGLSVHFQLLSTVASLPRSYFQLLAFSSAREGLPPSRARSLSSALAARSIRAANCFFAEYSPTPRTRDGVWSAKATKTSCRIPGGGWTTLQFVQ